MGCDGSDRGRPITVGAISLVHPLPFPLFTLSHKTPTRANPVCGVASPFPRRRPRCYAIFCRKFQPKVASSLQPQPIPARNGRQRSAVRTTRVTGLQPRSTVREPPFIVPLEPSNHPGAIPLHLHGTEDVSGPSEHTLDGVTRSRLTAS